MVFLVNRRNNNILCVRNSKQAMEIVSNGLEEGFSFGVYGAKNKQLFLLLYPEFKGLTFVSI